MMRAMSKLTMLVAKALYSDPTPVMIMVISSMLRRPIRSAIGLSTSVPTTYPARLSTTGMVNASKAFCGVQPGLIWMHVCTKETLMSKMSKKVKTNPVPMIPMNRYDSAQTSIRSSRAVIERAVSSGVASSVGGVLITSPSVG